MLPVELTKQLLRWRSLVILVVLVAVPVSAGAATASSAGHQNGQQGGLFGAAPFSALNHAAASLQFVAQLFLPVVVTFFGSALGAADKEWGTLRYLYVRPVGRSRLLAGKWLALVTCCLLATACIVVAGLVVGLAIFGWHDFHRIGAANLSAATGALRTAEATGYVAVCMAAVGTIAFALGLMLPASIEALGASVAFVVVANIVNGHGSPHWLAVSLPVHYWQTWQGLFDGSSAGLATGLAVQVATMVVMLALAQAVLARRDPAA